MRKLCIILGLLVAFQTPHVYASNWSAQLGIAPCLNDHAEPTDIRGARVATRYLPLDWHWGDVLVFLEGSATHFQSNLDYHHESINILAFSPVIRLNLLSQARIQPYLEGGIGGSWLSKQTFALRQLGGHWQFQDMVGLGLQFGADRRFYAGVQTIHYSNASLCHENRGITAPLLITAGMKG